MLFDNLRWLLEKKNLNVCYLYRLFYIHTEEVSQKNKNNVKKC